MKIKEYQKGAESTIIDYNNKEGLVLTAALSLIGEAGEILEQFNERTVSGQPLNREHFIEELGDVLWGCAFVCKVMGLDLEDVMAHRVLLTHGEQEFYTAEQALAHVKKVNQVKNKKIDFETFTKVAVAEPVYDASGTEKFHENLYVFCCQAVGGLEGWLSGNKEMADVSALDESDRMYEQERIKHFKAVQTTFVVNSLGDIIESLAFLGHKEYGTTLTEVAEYNIQKLIGRYKGNTNMVVDSNAELYPVMRDAFKVCASSARLTMFKRELRERNMSSKIELKSEIGVIDSYLKDVLYASNFTPEEIENLKKGNKLPKAGKEDYEAADLSIHSLMNSACKVADQTKKAHYKGQPLNKEKIGQYAGQCIKHMNETINYLGLNVSKKKIYDFFDSEVERLIGLTEKPKK